jgi:DNA-binding transcriptional LysR family regulator
VPKPAFGVAESGRIAAIHYDLVDLKVFLAVVEEGSLTRGAHRCNLAPSSVSARIRELEEAFGTPLLERQPRGVQATAAGIVMAEHARRCVAQLEQMHADLFPFSQGVTGRVTLFANNNAITSFLPDDLAVFFKAHPSVRITLEERNSNHIVAAVAEGRADVGIIAMDADHPLLEFFPYRKDELVLLVPAEHPLAKHRRVHFAECLSHPFISLLQGAVIHTYLANHALALGGRLDIRVQVSGYGAIARLVGSGAGIGVVPRSALKFEDPLSVAVLELDEPWAVRNLRICVHREAGANFYRNQLVATLRGSADRALRTA